MPCSQKAVSIYLYLLYVTQADTNHNAVSECKSKKKIILNIRYLTFACEVGYLLDIRNIQNLIFRKTHTAFCLDVMQPNDGIYLLVSAI